MTTISVAGTQVCYTSTGEGPGLVLVHGTSADGRSNFGHVVDRFADRRCVVTPDFGGSGDSTIPAGPLALDTVVEQIAGTIAHATPAPVDLLGDSLGAVVAAATAARHPSLVRRLVLVAGWADSADPRHQLVFGTWARLQRDGSELGNRYGLSLAVSPGFLTALGPETITAIAGQPTPSDTDRRIDLGLRIDIRAAVRTITAPTLVISGKYDFLVPGYQTRLLHELIPHSEYVELEAGHAAFLEQPDDLVELVRAFLFS
jgi:pimeloyl-ACP methyl ester carboxylesterase